MQHAFLRLAVSLSLLFLAGCSPGSRRLELTGHEGMVPKVAISPDGATAATLCGQTVKLFSASNGSEKASITAITADLAFSPDGSLLATAAGKIVTLWDAKTGKEKRQLQLEPDEKAPNNGGGEDKPAEKKPVAWSIQHVAFSPDGKRLAASSGLGGMDTASRGAAVWNLSAEESTPEKFLTASGCIAFSPDSRLLASGGGGMVSREGQTAGTVKLFDVEKGKIIADCRAAESSPADPFGVTACLAFSPDGKLLASGGSDTEALVEGTPGLNKNRAAVRFWEVPSGKLQISYEGAMKQHLALAFSPDGGTLYVAGGNPFPTMKTGAVKMFDVAGRRERKSLVDMKYQVQSIALSADGKTMVLASNNVGGDKDRAVMRKILQSQRGVGAPPPPPSSRQHQDTFVEVWSLK